jgi:uncharacterized protein (DUF1697 family)
MGGRRRQAWIALLRGINLGSRNKVAMPDLRALVADLGAEDVTTYVQSGNVLFRSALARSELVRRIEDEIRTRFGLGAVTRAVLLGRDTGLSMPLLPD